MVFVDEHKKSTEAIIQIFKEFEGKKGLTISLEKSTLYLAGISDQNRDQIISSFPFSMRELPLRYLGLPLLTKWMTKADYAPLIEKI